MNKEIEKVTFEGMELLPLTIKVVIANLQFIDFEFFLTKDKKKFFKIRPGIEAMEEMLIRYKSNGLMNIYLTEENFQNFLANVQKELSNKFFNPASKGNKENEENKILTLHGAYALLKESLSIFGFSNKSLDLAQDINKNSLTLMKNAPNIFNLFKKFKNDCNQSFLDAMLTGFTASCIVNTYVWKNDKIIEKLMLSSLLGDILLGKKELDFLEDFVDESDKLPDKIKNHPIETSKKLSKYPSIISPEVVECVQLHHEMPDGSGFPRKLNYNNMAQLPCILIISHFFSLELRKIDFDYTKKDILKEKLKDFFDVPNFENHMKVLIDIIDA